MLYHPNARRHDCPQERCIRCTGAELCDSFDALTDALKALTEGFRSFGLSLRKLCAQGDQHRSWALRRSGRQPKAWRWNGSWRRYRSPELPDNLVRMEGRR